MTRVVTRAVRVIIFGQVQGVWFRAWTEAEARARGLDGWVRNRRDGSVEAVFSGSAADVEAMLAACWQGPERAMVQAVEQSAHDVPVASGFSVKPTA